MVVDHLGKAQYYLLGARTGGGHVKLGRAHMAHMRSVAQSRPVRGTSGTVVLATADAGDSESQVGRLHSSAHV